MRPAGVAEACGDKPRIRAARGAARYRSEICTEELAEQARGSAGVEGGEAPRKSCCGGAVEEAERVTPCDAVGGSLKLMGSGPCPCRVPGSLGRMYMGCVHMTYTATCDEWLLGVLRFEEEGGCETGAIAPTAEFRIRHSSLKSSPRCGSRSEAKYRVHHVVHRCRAIQGG